MIGALFYNRMKHLPGKNLPALQRLARLKGVQASYLAMSKERREVMTEKCFARYQAFAGG